MNKPLLFSRLLQFSIILSFFLPFFFVGCENKSDESAATTDSSAIDTLVYDTLHTFEKNTLVKSTDTTSTKDTLKISKATTSIEKEKDKYDRLSTSLTDEYPVLSPLLVEKGIFTGIALVIDLAHHFIFMSLLIAFILIVLSLFIKYLDPQAIRSQVLHNIIALISVHLYIPGFFGDEQWGYWTCLVLLFLTIALDIYRLILTRSKKLY